MLHFSSLFSFFLFYSSFPCFLLSFFFCSFLLFPLFFPLFFSLPFSLFPQWDSKQVQNNQSVEPFRIPQSLRLYTDKFFLMDRTVISKPSDNYAEFSRFSGWICSGILCSALSLSHFLFFSVSFISLSFPLFGWDLWICSFYLLAEWRSRAVSAYVRRLFLSWFRQARPWRIEKLLLLLLLLFLFVASVFSTRHGYPPVNRWFWNSNQANGLPMIKDVWRCCPDTKAFNSR